MASFSSENNRNVVPNWRGYVETLCLGEMDSSYANLSKKALFPLDSYIKKWVDYNNPASASNLVCAGISNGQTDNIEVIKAAKFIVSNEKYLMPGPVLIAKDVLLGRNNNKVTGVSKESLHKKVNQLIGRKDFVKQQIHIFRQ